MADEIKTIIAIEANLTKIQGQLGTLEGNFKSSFGKLQGIASSALGALGVGFGVGAVIRYGKSVLDTAGHLQDLSEQVDISAQTLSGIKSTLEENGTTVDAFATGIFRLQKELGSIKNAGDPAAQAIKALGLDLDQLRNAGTDEFLKLVTDAFGKLDNPLQRNALGVQLLGKQFKELGPAIQAIAGRLDELRARGLTDEDIAKLDEFGDSLTRLSNRLQILAAGPLGKIAEAFEKNGDPLRREIDRIIQKFDELGARLRAFASFKFDFGNFKFSNKELESVLAAQRQAKDLAIGLEREEQDTKERRELNALIRKPKRTPFTAPPDTSAQKSVDAFVSGLVKQADALRVSAAEMESGREAAIMLGLALEFAAFKKKFLAEGSVLPKDFEQRFKQAADDVLLWEGRLRAAREEAAKMDKVREGLADLAEVQKQLGLAAGDNQLAEAVKPFDDLRSKLIALEVKLADLGELSEGVAEKIQTAFEQINFGRLQAELKAIASLQGPTSLDILDTGEGEDRAAAIEKTRALGVALKDLNDRQRQAEQLSLALGGSFDLVSEKLSIQRQRVEALTEKYGALSPEVKEAVAELRRLEEQMATQDLFEKLFGSLETGIGDTLRGLREGEQGLTDALRNLARNMLSAFLEEFNKLTLLNPLKNWLMDLLGIQGQRAPVLDLGKLLGFGGAAGQAATGVAANAPAAAAGPALITAAGQHSLAATALTSAAGALTAAAAAAAGALTAAAAALAGAALANPMTSASDALDAEFGRELEAVSEQLSESWNQITESMEQGIESLGATAAAGFGQFFSELGNVVMGGLEGLGDFAMQGLDFLGGLIGGIFAHEGGPIGPTSPVGKKKSKGGLKANERVIIAEDGEFMFSKEAVDAIGIDRLDFANEKHVLPRFHDGGPLQSNNLGLIRPSAVSIARSVPIVGGPGASDAPMNRAGTVTERSDPIHVTVVNDYSGSIDPRGIKTGDREVRRYVVEAIDHSPAFRNKIKDATR